ncbi:MAG: hypothetical protein JST89_11935 [Cyanobacteria bacterium SZAS-4]|nr:hypothetical protein [Cyanobacteria bacterium SZAS-4]
MTVMTFDKSGGLPHRFKPTTLSEEQHHVVINATQLYAVALLVVLALAVTLTLVLALPTVESFHFGNFRILPNDFAHFALLAL